MPDIIQAAHLIENADGKDSHVIELSIPVVDAPSSKTSRQFKVSQQEFKKPGVPRPAPVALKSFAIGQSRVAVSDSNGNLPNLEADPPLTRFSIRADANHFQGEVIFEGKWNARSDGHEVTFTKRFNAGTALSQNPIDVLLNTAIPQIGARINEVAPSVIVSRATDTDGKAIEIMQHTARLLKDGLEEVWASMEGLPQKDGRPVMAANPADLSDEEAEECWAQLLSEQLVGTPYCGPGVSHFGTNSEDDELFSKSFDAGDPMYPITYACQHLCTAAAVTRGLTDAAKIPIDARSAAAIRQWSPPGSLNSDQANRDAATGIANGVMKPGTCYVASDVIHVAFVLRVFKAGRIQLLDTGGMQTFPAPKSPFGTAGVVETGSDLTLGGLNFDTELIERITRTITARNGRSGHIGVFPPASKIRDALGLMKKARPLGIARFMLLDRLSDSAAKSKTLEERLRYASPALPMWFGGDNYSILRMLWSLRSHPHSDQFEARWFISFPQREIAREMMKSRSFKWSDLLSASGKSAAITRQLLHPAVYLGSLPNGQVRFVGRYSTTIEEEDGKSVTLGTWFDTIQSKVFKKSKDNPGVDDSTPTRKERGLPLDQSIGVAGGQVPAGFQQLLSLDQAQLPDYFKSISG
jgi:hypothetical protein